MKKNLNWSIAWFLLLFVSICSCHPGRKSGKAVKPIRWNGFGRETQDSIYKKNQILVFYKDAPNDRKRDLIRLAIKKQGVTVDAIRVCSSCDDYVELWNGQNIHTVIHGDGVSGGSGPVRTKGVGDDSLALYSLNYYNKPPVDTPLSRLTTRANDKYRLFRSGAGKDTIIVAVLDTGVDTVHFVNSQYLWKNRGERNDGSDADQDCLKNDVAGWNFLDSSNNNFDDNPGLHGTMISQYIIREFDRSPKNFVQIMALKTHDRDGYGDLFTTICAIHYAVKKGANIINASWGFYYFEDSHPYLDRLITKILPSKGVLFVTASGNLIPSEDKLANAIYQDSFHITLTPFELRDMRIHNFYPGCLSQANNNVITATTTNVAMVSPRQNHSSRYADMGVKADTVLGNFMLFYEPFTIPEQYISGSSFATAIASGKIGAFLPKTLYRPGINKAQVIGTLLPMQSQEVIFIGPLLISGKLIRDGFYIKPVVL